MAGKFSFIFISVLFLSALSKADADPVTDLIKKVVHAIKDELNTIADLVTKIHDGIANNFTEFQKQMVDLTRKALLKFVRRFRDSFDKIAEKSTPAGQKLAACIIEDTPDIIETAVTLFDENSICISDDLIVVAKGLTPLIEKLVETQEKGSKTADGIDKCGEDDIVCVATVAVDLLRILAELPDIIIKGIEPVLPDIETLFKTVKNCVNVVSTRQNFYNNSAKVLDKLATCAA